MEGKGLLEYEEKGEITKNFLADYEKLCLKIYSRWSLIMDFEEFYGYCVEKLVVRLASFDSTRSNIGNYVFNLILNEARRCYSREKHLSSADYDTVMLYQACDDQSLVQDIWEFACFCYKKGVYVDQKKLLSDYQEGLETPAVKTFTWLRARGGIN